MSTICKKHQIMINLCQIWQCEKRILLSQIHNNKIYSGYLEDKPDYLPLIANSVKMNYDKFMPNMTMWNKDIIITNS